MPTTKNNCYIVIPAFNEAKHIASVVSDLSSLYKNIVVVNDGSIDETADSAKSAGATVISHLTNRGQGAALRTGTKFAINASAEIIVHFDADGQFRVVDIARLIEPIANGEADIVFGSRFMDQTTLMPKTKKYVIMPIARMVNRLFFGINMTDPQSGFRAFSSGVSANLDWRQDGMAHCSEILYLAHRNKLKITEVPITVVYHEYGQKMSGGFKILKDLIIARFLN